MEDYRLASSVLRSSSDVHNTTTATASRVKRGRQSYLYDRDGRRLKGLKGEAARLMHNHRFFSTDEELHRLEQSLAAGQRSVELLMESNNNNNDSNNNSGGGGMHKFPMLPDMFGVLSSTAAGGNMTDVVNGENIAQTAVVPPTHRWSLVQQRHVTMKRGSLNSTTTTTTTNNNNNNNNNNHHHSAGSSSSGADCGSSLFEPPRVGSSGYRWVRTDALLVENALMSAFLTEKGGVVEEANVDTSMDTAGGSRRGDISTPWFAPFLSVPPEVEMSVVHAPDEFSPVAFFTVSADEYKTLRLDDDVYQPVVVEHSQQQQQQGNNSTSSCTTTRHWRFDFASTCKLLELYERFGNFVVIADRWKYTNSQNTAAAASSSTTTTTTIVTSPTAGGGGEMSMDAYDISPPVEVLMERYKLVTEAVLRYRYRLLDESIKNKCHSEEHNNNNNNNNVEEEEEITTIDGGYTLTSNHPLTSLMEKHPILTAQRSRHEWLSRRYRELCHDDSGGGNETESASLEEHTQESVMLAKHREDVLQRCTELATSSPQEEGGKDGQLLQGQFSLDVCKRGGGATGTSNSLTPPCSQQQRIPLPPPASPFWYDGLLEQVRRRYVREFLKEEVQMNVPYFRAVQALRRVDSQATALFEKLRVLTNDTTSIPQESEETCSLDIAAKHGKKRGGRERAVGRYRKRQQQQQQQSVDVITGEDSFQGVQEEVARVPLQCERLKLCVQAGWFLPPPNNVGVKEKCATTRGAFAANRALSNFSESLLLTLPSTVPRLHLGVEQELEKHLWEDHRALCDDGAEVQQLLGEARVLYTQNLILRRFAGRCGALEASLKKLASDAAAMEM